MDLDGLPPAVDVVTAGAVLGVSRTTAYERISAGRWPTRILSRSGANGSYRDGD